MARGRVFSSCPQRLNAQVPKKCCQLGTKQQMKTGWVILFQITRWHAPMVCNAWGCSLIVNSGPSGLLHAKTGAGARDFQTLVPPIQTLVPTMGASQCNPVTAWCCSPMHAHGNQGSCCCLDNPKCTHIAQKPSGGGQNAHRLLQMLLHFLLIGKV